MLRGTKNRSIGDAKLFEGGFGARILVGCFLSKNCIKINSFSASKCARGVWVVLYSSLVIELKRNELIMSYKGGISSVPHPLGGITSGRKEARKYVTEP
jgi:hypothetical protein